MTAPLKIACAIASRGRPVALCGVIATLWRLQSGQNHLAFTVACDDDDAPTQAMLATIAADGEIPVIPVPALRAPTLGAAQNRAIQRAMDADLVTLPSDRTFCISGGWDALLADAHRAHPNRVLWWSSPEDMDTVLPVLPKAWLDLTDWRYSPEAYPFWYDDTGLMEVDRMAFGGPSLMTRAAYSGARQRTTRGRDFAFWTEAFVARRSERVALAKRLALALNPFGWTEPPAEMMADFHRRDDHLRTNAALFEERFGDTAEPSEQYRELKRNAEEAIAA